MQINPRFKYARSDTTNCISVYSGIMYIQNDMETSTLTKLSSISLNLEASGHEVPF